MKDALPNLRRISAELGGRPVELVLRVASAGFELPLLPNPGAPRSEPRRISCLATLFQGLIETIDGAAISREQASAFAANATSAAGLLQLRSELYEDERHAGRVYLGCPHCARESELDLAAFALALGTMPWPVAGADGSPAEPALAALYTPAARPSGVPPAARARLELPSMRRGLAGPFSEAMVGARVTIDRHLQASRRFLPPERPFDAARPHWSLANPAFRALLNMALALDSLDAERDLTPDTIERLPMTDFAFVDAACHFLHDIDVPDAEKATVVCPGCRQKFLLVLA